MTRSDTVSLLQNALYQEDPVNALFADAQHDTIADRRDSDAKYNNGWRSLPIVESGVFERCAVCVRRVRSCAVVCVRVRCCAVVCGFYLAITKILERRASTSVELANDVVLLSCCLLPLIGRPVIGVVRESALLRVGGRQQQQQQQQQQH